MYIYTRYQLDEKQPIGQRHVERSSSANSYRDISLLFPSALNGCACARTNREQASRAASRTRLTRARERTTTNALARSLARSSSAHGAWKVARHHDEPGRRNSRSPVKVAWLGSEMIAIAPQPGEFKRGSLPGVGRLPSIIPARIITVSLSGILLSKRSFRRRCPSPAPL